MAWAVSLPCRGRSSHWPGGAIFGTFAGTIYNVLASNLGATLAFFMARFLGRELVAGLLKGGKLATLDERVAENGFWVIFRLRVIPVIPFNGLNFGAGFYGVEVLHRYLYREVAGARFYSVTVRGRKFVKRPNCVFIGQQAIYLGPFSQVCDDDGHAFPRGVPVEVCTDTAEKLQRPPYAGIFLLTDPTRGVAEGGCCAPAPGEKGCC